MLFRILFGHTLKSGFTFLTTTTVSLIASVAVAVPNESPVVSAEKTATRVAKSVVSDANAKKIHRSVSNETLKPLSTRDSSLELEPGAKVDASASDTASTESTDQPLRSANVEIEPAPGTRAPAASEKSEPAPATAPAAHSANGSHTATSPAVPAEKALSWLANGNNRYLKKAMRTDGRSQKDRDRLAKGQHPHAIVLTCSDSRVPPETVFDQALGEIFVVRTAGQSLDSAVIASLEYAVEHLGPRLLVVMGHTSCGAVKAAIETAEDSSAGSPALDQLVHDIRPRIPVRTPASSSKALEIESSANAQGVAADLLKRSDIIRARVEKGDLLIKPALYYIDSGVVKFY